MFIGMILSVVAAAVVIELSLYVLLVIGVVPVIDPFFNDMLQG
jgi:hypothetical protein